MPISKKRKKTAVHDAHEKQIKQEPINLDSPRWVAPSMIASFLIGLLYVITFYIAGTSVPGMSSLSAAANIGIGFSLIIIGFYISTKWR
jgi:formate/nitrite transporter FocA (FNT family)